MTAADSSKPTVLHIGDSVKYNHEFYNNEFASRFNVVQATETDRDSFIEALKTKKYVFPELASCLYLNSHKIKIWQFLGYLSATFPDWRIHGSMGL